MPYDPTSLSNLDEVKTNHIHLDLAVSFEKKTLSGSAELEIEAIADNVTKVILDTSFIAIHSVAVAGQTLKVPSSSCSLGLGIILLLGVRPFSDHD